MAGRAQPDSYVQTIVAIPTDGFTVTATLSLPVYAGRTISAVWFSTALATSALDAAAGVSTPTTINIATEVDVNTLPATTPAATLAPSNSNSGTLAPTATSVPPTTSSWMASSPMSSSASSKSSPEASSRASTQSAVLASSQPGLNSPKEGVAVGALAGAAVASFIVGLITAALIMWAMRNHRHGRRPNRLSSSAVTPVNGGSSDDSSRNGHKYLPMIPVSSNVTDKALPGSIKIGSHDHETEPDPVMSMPAPVKPPATTFPPSSFVIKRKRVSATPTLALTRRSSDMQDRYYSELRTQVKTLFEQLEIHVDNFYTEASGLPLTDEYRHNLQQVDSPYLPDSIIGLLPEVSGDKIKPLIKHCLAYAIFSRIGGSSDHVDKDDTLLPDGLVAITRAIQPSSTTRVSNPEAYEQQIDRLSLWKHDTVAMMDIHAIVKSADIQTKINKLAWKCVRGLESWSLARYGKETKKSHLMRVMEEAVELGLRVFGEKKGLLVWQWEQNAVDTRGAAKVGDFVLFPGLELRRELGTGKAGTRADGESDRNVGGNASGREVILTPTMASM